MHPFYFEKRVALDFEFAIIYWLSIGAGSCVIPGRFFGSPAGDGGLPPRRIEYPATGEENSGGLWGGRKRWCVRRTLRRLHSTGETPVPPEDLKAKTGLWPLFSNRVLDRAGGIGYKSSLPERRRRLTRRGGKKPHQGVDTEAKLGYKNSCR